MPEGENGQADAEEEEEPEAEEEEAEEPEETIEDLFKGGQSEDDGEEEEDDDEEEGGQDSGEVDDEDDGDREDDGESDEEDNDGEVASRDEEEGEDDEDEISSDDDVEDSNGDDPAGFLDDGSVASGIDEELLAADDRTEPPEFVGGGSEGSWLTTGIDALDEHLGGGIPPGRILSFVATADTQSELLVKHLAAQHDCLYLSTLRPKWEVEEEVTDYVQKSAASTGGTSVHIEQLTPDSRLDSARRHVENLDGRSIVVIDSANELETLEKERYVYFMDELKRKLWETGSVGLFYCIEEEQPPGGRDVTLRRADLIWQLRPSDDSGGLHHQLVISKFRSGRALSEPLTVSLTDEVAVVASSDGT